MMPAFLDDAARRRWTSYFAEVDRLLGGAVPSAAGLREDLERHVVDSMASRGTGRGDATGELDRLNAALSRLGQPVDYLRPLLADELLDRATRTYNPLPLTLGLFHAIRAGSSRALMLASFGLGYLLLLIFAAAALLKPFWGSHVGVFLAPDGTLSAGIVRHGSDARDLLGWWFIPIALTLATILYVILTRALGHLRKRR